tara:strand:- start:292 stop:1266 length:975 start_codon:yes stop_codon:yes gene_type:complete
MKDTVLVTGGAGYIGAHIVDLLCESGFNVLVLDNLSNGFKENLNSKAEFVLCDITNKESLESIFSSNSISSIIHMAALKSVSESMENTDIYNENNIFGSINLISMAVKYKIKKFIFSSTAAVYGSPQIDHFIDEYQQTNPINHYGFTKLYIENYLEWISKLYPIKFVAFRYFNAAGYSKKNNLILYKEKSPENLLPIIMEVANCERDKLNIFGNDYNTTDGTCIRDYIHVLDLADAHVKAISFLDHESSEVINLSTGIGYSVLDVLKTSEKVLGKRIEFTFSDRRKGDPPKLISSFNKARKLLSWEPKYDLSEIIDSMWKIYRK